MIHELHLLLFLWLWSEEPSFYSAIALLIFYCISTSHYHVLNTIIYGSYLLWCEREKLLKTWHLKNRHFIGKKDWLERVDGPSATPQIINSKWLFVPGTVLCLGYYCYDMQMNREYILKALIWTQCLWRVPDWKHWSLKSSGYAHGWFQVTEMLDLEWPTCKRGKIYSFAEFPKTDRNMTCETSFSKKKIRLLLFEIDYYYANIWGKRKKMQW